MHGRIKGNGVGLEMRCDELVKELEITDVITLVEVKSMLEKLRHTIGNIVLDLDIREDELGAS